MKVTKVSIPDILLIETDVYEDSRGFFSETYQQRRYAENGVSWVFVQDNFARSRQNVLRGLHYQLRHAQGKLVYVTNGAIFDVSVDIRRGSPTFGRWVGFDLSHGNGRQIFVPPGFAHGYSVVSDHADVIYKCTDFYDPDDEYGIFWADPNIGIQWPVQKPVLSSKDQQYPGISHVPEELLPAYQRPSAPSQK